MSEFPNVFAYEDEFAEVVDGDDMDPFDPIDPAEADPVLTVDKLPRDEEEDPLLVYTDAPSLPPIQDTIKGFY
jgi:hypothetical protein